MINLGFLLRFFCESGPRFTSAHAGTADSLDAARSRCLQRLQFIKDTVEPSFSCPGLSPCLSCA